MFTASVGSEKDVDRAVESARATYESGVWSEAPPSTRKVALHHFADLITKEADSLDALDAAEMGKPIGQSFGNAIAACKSHEILC